MVQVRMDCTVFCEKINVDIYVISHATAPFATAEKGIDIDYSENFEIADAIYINMLKGKSYE